MTTVHGTRLAGLDRQSLRAGVETVLEPHRRDLADDSPTVVVPDAHYPHHPSTGLVTDPAVVAAVAEMLPGPVEIAVLDSEFVDGDRAARYLGYDDVVREPDADLLDLSDADRVERTVHLTRESVTLSVPEPLLDGAVNLPTARRSPELGLEAGMANLARAVADSPVDSPADDAADRSSDAAQGGEPDAATIRAVTHVCDPAVTLTDATRVYAGEPFEAKALLASDDVVAASLATADLLGLDRGSVPHLDAYEAEVTAPIDIRGPDPDAIAASVPEADPDPAGDDEAMAAAYRLYARVSGDLVPPQMLGGGTDG